MHSQLIIAFKLPSFTNIRSSLSKFINFLPPTFYSDAWSCDFGEDKSSSIAIDKGEFGVKKPFGLLSVEEDQNPPFNKVLWSIILYGLGEVMYLTSIPIFDVEERNARTFKYGQFTEEQTVAEVQQLISCRLVYLSSINCKLLGCKSYVVTGLAMRA